MMSSVCLSDRMGIYLNLLTNFVASVNISWLCAPLNYKVAVGFITIIFWVRGCRFRLYMLRLKISYWLLRYFMNAIVKLFVNLAPSLFRPPVIASIVLGSSWGNFIITTLIKSREFDTLCCWGCFGFWRHLLIFCGCWYWICWTGCFWGTTACLFFWLAYYCCNPPSKLYCFLPLLQTGTLNCSDVRGFDRVPSTVGSP